jgi:hypothetical protein
MGKRRLWKCSVSPYGSSEREMWGEGNFAGDSERYVKEASGDRHLPP